MSGPDVPPVFNRGGKDTASMDGSDTTGHATGQLPRCAALKMVL